MDIMMFRTFISFVLLLFSINGVTGSVCLSCNEDLYPEGGGILTATDGAAEVNLQETIRFNGIDHNKIYVNTHGSISFGLAATSYVSFCNLGTMKLPISFPPFSFMPIVYLYHFQLDPCGGQTGKITHGIDSTTETLARATAQIRDCMNDPDFTASQTVVVTWVSVGRFTCVDEPHTFQGVLVSDGTKTYIIQIYKTLNEEAIAGDKVMVGINFGLNPIDPTNFEAIEYKFSCKPGVLMLPESSNVGCTGTFIYRLDTLQPPRDCEVPTLDTAHMDFDIEGTAHGNVANVVCHDGYQLVTGVGDDGFEFGDFETQLVCNDGDWENLVEVEGYGFTCQFSGQCPGTKEYGCDVCPKSPSVAQCEADKTFTPFTFSTNEDGELVYTVDGGDRSRGGDEYQAYLTSAPQCMNFLAKKRNGEVQIRMRNSNKKTCIRQRATSCVIGDLDDGDRCYECYEPKCAEP